MMTSTNFQSPKSATLVTKNSHYLCLSFIYLIRVGSEEWEWRGGIGSRSWVFPRYKITPMDLKIAWKSCDSFQINFFSSRFWFDFYHTFQTHFNHFWNAPRLLLIFNHSHFRACWILSYESKINIQSKIRVVFSL